MRWIAPAFLFACALAVACVDWRAKVPPKYLPIAEVHHGVCGNCHKRVEPGQRTRAVFERALRGHHRRVKLTDAQWAELVDYLSQTP